MIEGVVLKANLIPLEMCDFDVILGWIGYPSTEHQSNTLQRKLFFENLDYRSWSLKKITWFCPMYDLGFESKEIIAKRL